MQYMDKIIYLTKGASCIVDSIDYQYLSQFHWSLNSNGYAVRHVAKSPEYMHRIIMSPTNGLTVDHINGNRLDNRRANLRLATVSQQHYNSKKRSRTSRYKGVYWHKQRQKWHSSIRVDGHNVSLGLHKSERLAAISYDRAAARYFGEFARLNFTQRERTDTPLDML